MTIVGPDKQPNGTGPAISVTKRPLNKGSITVFGVTYFDRNTERLAALHGDVRVQVIADASDLSRVLVRDPESGSLIQVPCVPEATGRMRSLALDLDRK